MSFPLSNYEKARLERIRENQLVLAEIGLNSAAKAIRRAEADAKIARRANAALKRAALKRKREEERDDDDDYDDDDDDDNKDDTTSSSSNGLRRSSRKRGAPPSHGVLTTKQIAEAQRKRPPRKKRKKIKSQQLSELTTSQNATLDKAQDWLTAMGTFLSTHGHGSTGNSITAVNLGRTLNKLSILASGAGLTYGHWGDGVVFHPFPIDLHTDTLTLLEDAREWSLEHGKDLGNGWLMKHPITKLACYQVHLSQPDDDLHERDLKIKKKYNVKTLEDK